MTLLKQFKVTDSDLDVSTGQLVMLTGVTALRQRIETRLQTFLGECFLDASIGVPYFKQVFGAKNPKVSVLNASFLGASALGSVEGIDRVTRLEYDLSSNRTLTVDLIVLAETGEEANQVLSLEV